MAFVKTTWNDDNLPDIDAAQLNRIEKGIADAHAMAGMQLIGELTLGGSGVAGQLGIANIPQNFTHLRLISRLQSGQVGTDNAGLRINGIQTGTYNWTYKGMSQAGAFDGVSANQTYAYLGAIPGTNRANDNYIGNQIVDLPFYSLGDCIKTWHSLAAMANGVADYYGVTAQGVCIATANAITSLAVLAAATAVGPRSRAFLYGIM
jgi:hypothetical protein